MKLRAQLVVVPCVTFAARARLAAGEGSLTPIEVVTLKAIGNGLDDVDSIEQIVGLGTRPVLDLIYDFWLKGYVLVDTAQARVRLAGGAARAFAAGTLEKLATAENNIEVVPLVQELVSGAVLPHVGRLQPQAPESAMVPTQRSGLDLAGVTRIELLDAVQREVEHRSRKAGRDLVVQEAWVEPEQLLVDAETDDAVVQQRRFLHLFADIQQDPDSGRLVFDIVEAPDLSRPLRQTVARALSTLNERMPDQLFFKRIRQEVSRDHASDSPIVEGASLPRLEQAVVGLESTDRGVVDARHAQIRELYIDACQEVKEVARREALVRPVVGYPEHEEEIGRLIKTSERQLVLANPWIRMASLVEPPPGADLSWFDLLDQALGREVQVFLLWGIAPDSILDSAAATALSDLGAKHEGRLVFSRRSSTLHAKFVVRDAHEALVTSFNFLDPPQTRDSLELGLHVRGVQPEVAPEAVLDLLEWSRDTFPDFIARRRMLLLPHELGAAELELLEVPSAPGLPAPEATYSPDGAPAPAIRHWAEEWRAVSDQLKSSFHRRGQGARLIVDREHREVLWRALRSSQARLAVLSDRVSVDVVTNQFVRMLKTRVDADVSCTFLYRREGATDQADGPSHRLREEARRAPDLCKLVEARSHAKVLVCDDDVTVGSFNFLSYGGDYSSGQRERAELSIHVHSREAVDQVLDTLEAEWPGNFSHLRGQSRQAPEKPALKLPPSLQPLFHAMQGAEGPGAALLEWFAKAENPWDDLEALHRAGLRGDDLHQAAAAAIASARDIGAEPTRRWRAILAMERWRLQDFVGSALLLSSDGHAACAVPPWLVSLGAVVDGPKNQDAPQVPEATEITPPESLAATVLLMVAILRDGRFDLLEILDQLAQTLPIEAEDWPEAIGRYYQATYQALPMTLLRRAAGQQQLNKEIAAAKDGFGKALLNAENVGFRFPLGEHTWKRLKMEGYLLGELRLAHDQDDASRLDGYLSSLDESEVGVEKLMDDTSYEVRDEHNNRIDEPKRSVCLKRLGAALEAAREWLSLSLTAAPAGSDAKVLDACSVLRGELNGLRCGGTLEHDAVVAPTLLYARQRLAALLGEVTP